jgi:hypothetical protein
LEVVVDYRRINRKKMQQKVTNSTAGIFNANNNNVWHTNAQTNAQIVTESLYKQKYSTKYTANVRVV